MTAMLPEDCSVSQRRLTRPLAVVAESRGRRCSQFFLSASQVAVHRLERKYKAGEGAVDDYIPFATLCSREIRAGRR